MPLTVKISDISCPSILILSFSFCTNFIPSNNKEINSKVIILISDGEDFGDNTEESLNKIIESNYKLFTIGIGSEKGAEAPFYSTINIFERTYKRCKKRNRYTLTFSEPVSSILENSTKALLKKNGFEVVSQGENTGNVQFNIKTKSSYFKINFGTVKSLLVHDKRCSSHEDKKDLGFIFSGKSDFV